MFAIPFLLLAYLKLTGTPLYILMIIGLIGALVMYCFELMAMKVEGVRTYFSDGFNMAD